MKRWFSLFAVALAMVIFLVPCTSQSANPTAASTARTVKSPAAAPEPQPGGIWKVLVRSKSNVFGYPPRIAASGRDYAPPFFDRLLRAGEKGKYEPALALSWEIAKDGKAITFKLRKGVTFHDGTPFNAQAVKFNVDNLILPESPLIPGIASVDVIDDYTVRLNLPSFNNLILYHFAANPATFMYSPEALKKNNPDWAMTHPVGTGPFMLKDYQPNISVTLVKNPNYWQKGLPYLDGIEMSMVSDPMTQILAFKAGQAQAIYDPQGAAAQLRDEGYPLQLASGSVQAMNFDTGNSKIFANLKVRQAIEYAIDKDAICAGPGQGLYKPMYQFVAGDNPDYNKGCPPRKYDPARAKKLLSEAGYPNGFNFKVFVLDTSWKDGWVAAQSYLDAVGIKMEINYINIAAYNLIRAGKIEKGAAALQTYPTSANTLYLLDSFLRSDSGNYAYLARPAGIDKLIDQAKLSRDAAAIAKIKQQVIKSVYDEASFIPLWQSLRIAVVDKSVQNSGWFINGYEENNQPGRQTWLKK